MQKVLIVEDDIAIAKTLRDCLEKEGYEARALDKLRGPMWCKPLKSIDRV